MVTTEKIPLTLSPKEWLAIQGLLERLQQSYGSQIRQALLFGSKARGEAQQDSDIDILLLVENENWALKDAITDVAAEVNLEYDLQIDARVIGLQRWQHLAETQAGLYRTIIRDAIPLAM